MPILVLLIVGTILIVMGQHNVPYQKNNGFVFGTVYNIIYQCDSDLHNSIKAELQKVDFALSPFNEESVISAVNRGEGSINSADTMFTYVFNLAMTISEETEGAFDITVAPLVNAWGFGTAEGIFPSEQQVDSLKALIGYKKIKGSKLPEGMKLDCSSIAKGYACDVVATMLRTHGVENYMIEIGGEIVSSGVSEKRVPWRIGVERPTDDSLSMHTANHTILNITDMAMATSGNYRNFYYRDGKKYAHTIDPRTGYPVQHNILSSTVIAHDCATADAYATAFMVLGLDEAKAVLERHPELMAYFIYYDEHNDTTTTSAYKVWLSDGLKEKMIK